MNLSSKKQTEKKYALLSVFNKEGIVDFAKALHKLGYKIISTGGTAKTLLENAIEIVPIQEITGNPESFDGRMKTISFQIESGILFDRTNPSHVKQAKELNIKPIDIVVCNLYPFEKTVSDPKVKLEDAVENIDVGGPTMIRAAGKNFQNVLVVVDTKDYQKIVQLLKGGNVNEKTRKELAAKAFTHLSFYDSQIASYLREELFPKEITLAGRKMANLRYGENPHQKAAVYLHPNTNSPFASLKKHWGRELSLLNVTDINAGLESVRLFDPKTEGVAAVVIKHNSPCGLALGKTSKEALDRAVASDPESAFGGIIVLNNPIDLKTAKVIGSFKDERKANIDIVAVPNIDQDALEYLQKLRKSMGIYTFGKTPKKRTQDNNLKWIDGGFILQTGDNKINDVFKQWKVVTKSKPTKKQLEQMKTAWKFVTRVRSNSVIIVDKSLPMTRGIGSGQTSRLRSTQIAFKQANGHAKGAILASDSFFPFDDSVKLAAKAGIGAIIQQGGSVNDQASIDAADKAGIPMIFTDRRAFWH
ncbi:MAG: bifunctional phosphoribosylaminoimidazolecarboxamide formyltransferase/IMP cyclohydrolase [Candidatus Levybacteria bacterium]|nr:bifunctional phosphoribosylaminoimidazolecarboxamide formyltransferase/IMP cyclohydrolase [Candidatus Levybacteria bacterium]